MCSIVGSWHTEKLKELIAQNEGRGSLYHSISYYDRLTGNIDIKRNKGRVDLDAISIPKHFYCIVHMQAPTDNMNGVHPAIYAHPSGGKAYLWHNGIVKPPSIKAMYNKLKLENPLLPDTKWDTELILRTYCEFGTAGFANIDGSFSCLMYYDKDLYLFRNEIAPMFVDHNLTISSTHFDFAAPTEPNVLHQMGLHDGCLYPHGTFKTVNNPYFFATE